MTTSVIPDSPVDPDESPRAARPATEPVEPEPRLRRFTFDPASSPVLTAALAWESVGARR